ncbi:DUF4097 domain-containing protein [Actinomycetospora endophytica]|uniref:DUF4097 domain-containing protein n=1 Tax=Actinomycetospora endophytica TaxID=2291215 RepID=A0ABS8PG36_9PSEU|nr:DUF4097 family beta strand repeat-containing protein [Actinomycetospora endophytica]MCD2197220.1 DUF4097 domain-containing protein [Actinomycetospora endophytica]
MSAPSRTERHDVEGPVDVVVEIDAGRVDVRLDQRPETSTDASPAELRVEVTADPEGAPGWVRGLAGLVDAAGGLERRFGFDLGAMAGLGVRPGEDPEERARRAVDAVEITLADGRLSVRGPREVALRAVPLAVTVHAPAGSGVAVRAGAAPVDVAGRPGAVEIGTTGSVSVSELTARSAIRCGAGDVSVGRVGGVLKVKGGAGDITLDEVLASTEVVTGSGSVAVARVAADLAVRAGSGDVTVRDASAGDLDLSTGAGSVRVGVHSGVDASVDLRSAAGSASSDLPVSSSRPEGTTTETVVPLRIRGRAAAGNARVSTASSS